MFKKHINKVIKDEIREQLWRRAHPLVGEAVTVEATRIIEDKVKVQFLRYMGEMDLDARISNLIDKKAVEIMRDVFKEQMNNHTFIKAIVKEINQVQLKEK